jgi:hypothetical protein
VGHLFASIGDRNSQQAKIFTDKLRTRIQGIQRDNQQLTVGDFLAFVSDYANEAFDPTTAYRIANRMAQFSTNDPNVVSSGRLRDDYQLNTVYLLGALE